MAKKLKFVTNVFGSETDRISRADPLMEGCVVGEPQATEIQSVKELKAQGLVGLYRDNSVKRGKQTT